MQEKREGPMKSAIRRWVQTDVICFASPDCMASIIVSWERPKRKLMPREIVGWELVQTVVSIPFFLGPPHLWMSFQVGAEILSTIAEPTRTPIQWCSFWGRLLSSLKRGRNRSDFTSSSESGSNHDVSVMARLLCHTHSFLLCSQLFFIIASSLTSSVLILSLTARTLTGHLVFLHSGSKPVGSFFA